MKFKAIIFDLDGVICFTDEYHYQAWKALADSIDVPFDRTVNNRLRGVSRMASLEIILENAPQKYTPEEKEAFATKKNDLYRELLKNMSEKNLDERTKDVLTILRQRGYLLAIGSSSKNTPFILERIGLDHFFDVVVDGNCIQHSKPDPEVFLTAAERLHVAPVDCLVVEDAISGAEAGHAGGIVLPVVFASLILSCRLFLESVKNKMQKKAFFLLFNPVVLSWLIVLIMKDNKESK